MGQHHGPVHLKEVLSSIQVGAKTNGEEVVGYLLPFLRSDKIIHSDTERVLDQASPRAAHHVGGDVGLYEVGGPEVAHPAQQVEGAVPHGDQRLLSEHDGLAPVSRLGELGEHDARHAGLTSVVISVMQA